LPLSLSFSFSLLLVFLVLFFLLLDELVELLLLSFGLSLFYGSLSFFFPLINLTNRLNKESFSGFFYE
jgi:hypothetical protein